MENFITNLIIKMLFGNITPMQTHVKNIVNHLVICALLIGIMIGGIILFVFTSIMIFFF